MKEIRFSFSSSRVSKASTIEPRRLARACAYINATYPEVVVRGCIFHVNLYIYTYIHMFVFLLRKVKIRHYLLKIRSYIIL